jgi:hypothetical protein
LPLLRGALVRRLKHKKHKRHKRHEEHKRSTLVLSLNLLVPPVFRAFSWLYFDLYWNVIRVSSSITKGRTKR